MALRTALRSTHSDSPAERAFLSLTLLGRVDLRKVTDALRVWISLVDNGDYSSFLPERLDMGATRESPSSSLVRQVVTKTSTEPLPRCFIALLNDRQTCKPSAHDEGILSGLPRDISGHHGR